MPLTAAEKLTEVRTTYPCLLKLWTEAEIREAIPCHKLIVAYCENELKARKAKKGKNDKRKR